MRHRDQFADSGAIGGLDDLHGIGRQAGAGQAFLDDFCERLVAMDRFRAAAQYRRIATLDAQAGGVDGDVRPRLVNNADDAERHAHLADLDAARTVFHVRDFTDRICQRDNLFKSFRHCADGLVRQRQAVQHGGCEAAGERGVEVELVRCAQQRGIAADRCGDQRKRLVFCSRVSFRHGARGKTGALAKVGHVLLNVHHAFRDP